MDIKTDQGSIVTVNPGTPTFFEVSATFSMSVEGRSTPLTLNPSEIVTFDGQILVHNGTSYNLPKITGAIKMGWLVLPDQEASFEPLSAGIKVRPAEGGNPKNEHAKSTLTTVQTDTSQVATRTGGAFVHQLDKTYVDGSGQGGVPVRTLKTAAVSRNEVTPASIGLDLAAANNVVLEPGKGMSRDDMLARMDPYERDAYLAQINSRKASKVITSHAGGIQTTTTVGSGSSATFDAGAIEPGKSVETVTYQDGIRFSNTNGPKVKPSTSGEVTGGQSTVTVVGSVSKVSTTPQLAPQPAPQPVQLRPAEVPTTPSQAPGMQLMIAKSICSDFPDTYDFASSPRKKIARLVSDFEDRLDIIKAAFLADNDVAFKEKLLTEFPEILA